MPEQLLTIFKICLLILLYLFFFRVLRAVWTQVQPAGSAALMGDSDTTRAGRRRGRSKRAGQAPAEPPPVPTRLAVLDPPPIAGAEYQLSSGMTMGRHPDSSIVVEDSFLSQRHATFEYSDGTWFVTDLGSTNGTYVNDTRIGPTAPLFLGDLIRVGNVVFEVR